MDILATEVDEDALERVVTQLAPRVAVVAESVRAGLLARLESSQTTTGVLLLANSPTRRCETPLRSANVTCLDQSAEPTDILAAVHLVSRERGVRAGADDDRVDRPSRNALQSLTPRETQVFEYLRRETPNAVIAFEMKISVATVRTHIRAVFRKLGVKSRRELIDRAL